MTVACFFAAFQNVSFSHSFGHVKFDGHRGGIHVSLMTGVLENMEILCPYEVIQFVGYDPALCQLEFWSSQEIGW